MSALGTLPLYAQDGEVDARTAQETETGETFSEVESRPQEREITAMADGGEWVEEYVSVGAGKYPALGGNPNLEFAGYATYIIINGQAAMPSFGHFLDDKQVLAITDYLQTNLDNDYEADGTLQEQPELPTRSVFAVAGLANPACLVEIEVVAVRSGS